MGICASDVFDAHSLTIDVGVYSSPQIFYCSITHDREAVLDKGCVTAQRKRDGTTDRARLSSWHIARRLFSLGRVFAVLGFLPCVEDTLPTIDVGV